MFFHKLFKFSTSLSLKNTSAFLLLQNFNVWTKDVSTFTDSVYVYWRLQVSTSHFCQLHLGPRFQTGGDVTKSCLYVYLKWDLKWAQRSFTFSRLWKQPYSVKLCTGCWSVQGPANCAQENLCNFQQNHMAAGENIVLHTDTRPSCECFQTSCCKKTAH